MKEDISARCKNCKIIWDVEILRERKDYIAGKCPICGGYLKRLRKKERR